MSTVIRSVDPNSPAERAHIAPGEQLLAINGHTVADVLDYRYYGYDPVAVLHLRRQDGTERTVRLRKAEGQDLGLNFDTYLMDEMRTCANHCVFCFVDQMPPGMRQTLYFKDDDARLSFLLGNYITLTNLTEREAQRIIDLHVSPINVSVHATDPKLHCAMLGNPGAERSLRFMRSFGQAGIEMNGQIVVCPGWNDGAALRRTLEDLMDIGFRSCSIVPVGITKYRDGLAPLRPVDRDTAGAIIDVVDEYAAAAQKRFGTRMFFSADELYLRAGRPLPPAEYYEEFRQLENGVGMLRSLESEFLAALPYEELPRIPSPFTIATGRAAEPFLRGLLQQAQRQFPGLQGQVVGIDNDFFGRTIDVAGLLTGQDLSAQLQKVELGERVLIPIHMLRHGETVFLDDYTVERLEREIGCRVQVVGADGGDLADAMFTGG